MTDPRRDINQVIERAREVAQFERLTDAQRTALNELQRHWRERLCALPLNEFDDLRYHTLTGIEFRYDGQPSAPNGANEVIFTLEDGRRYRLYHYQDCCENVQLQDTVGNPFELLGHPLELAELATNSGMDGDFESYTWSFYKLVTVRGAVTLRWLGTSNGYYAETVSFEAVP